MNTNENEETQVTVCPKVPPDALMDLKMMARDIVINTLKVASKYVVMVTHIRRFSINSDYVREALKEAGFVKSRVSEIIKVCEMPELEWNKVIAGEVGWRGALEIARGSADQITATLHIDAAVREYEEQHSERTPEQQQAAVEQEEETTTKTARQQITEHLTKAMRIAAKHEIKKASARFRDKNAAYFGSINTVKALGGKVNE